MAHRDERVGKVEVLSENDIDSMLAQEMGNPDLTGVLEGPGQLS
jgi:hypothetical protein